MKENVSGCVFFLNTVMNTMIYMDTIFGWSTAVTILHRFQDRPRTHQLLKIAQISYRSSI